MGNIIDRIVKFCDHLGMSISSFAASIGVNQVTLNNYKLGKRKPSLELIEKVTKKYPELSLDWLINGVEPMMCCNKNSDPNAPFLLEEPAPSRDQSELLKRINFLEQQLKLEQKKSDLLQQQINLYENKV